MGFRKSGYLRNISTLFMPVVIVFFVFTSGCALFGHAPVAAFEANPTQGGPAPMTVTFTDKSSGSGITSEVWQYKLNPDSIWTTFSQNSYEWTTFSLDRYSSYKFEKAGSYDIKLIVTGKGGSDEIIKTKYINIGCDFSKQDGKERCFGGIGSQCGGIIQSQILSIGVIPFTKNEDTCTIEGRVSVGSIHHDRCCLATNNAGWSCPALNEGDNTRCKEEWQEAWDDTQCSLLLGGYRQWKYSFGPYPLGNKGDVIFTNDDSIPNKIKAPTGTRINPIYQKNYCQSGKCTEENGITKIEKDFCGEYCTCQ